MLPSRSQYHYHPLSDEDTGGVLQHRNRKSRWAQGVATCTFSSQPAKRFVLLTLAFSMLLPTVFILGYMVGTLNLKKESSPYINLGFTKPEILQWYTEYSDVEASEARLNELWDTQIPWEAGIIALKNEEAREMNLPPSQPFPWDSGKKSLYIVNAHHILHCVRNVYISIQQYRANKTQTINYPHIVHCLDSLRVEAMCSADDTLRYVPLNSAHGFRPGDGQPRKCRDWEQVRRFVETHDSCYRYLKPGDHELSNLERFKFCSRDSEYLPKIRKHFGYDEDWIPGPQGGPRELEW